MANNQSKLFVTNHPGERNFGVGNIKGWIGAQIRFTSNPHSHL